MQIIKGSTYRDTLYWATSECVFKTVTAVSTTAPVQLTVPDHGVVDGWMVGVEGHKNIDPESQKVRVIDANTLELPCVNGTQFRAQTTPIVIRYNAPVDMAGYTARQQFKAKVDDPLLLALTTENGGIIIDNVAKTITRVIAASDTAAIVWSSAMYDLEMVQGLYVTKIDAGIATVIDEVTT